VDSDNSAELQYMYYRNLYMFAVFAYIVIISAFCFSCAKAQVIVHRDVVNEDCARHTLTRQPVHRPTPCLKKHQNCFRQNFVKFPPTLTTFWHKDAEDDEIM